jgi:RNA polymerase sigma-70 factor (sigma-E family)
VNVVAIGRWPGRQRAAGPAEAWVGDGTIAPGDPVRGDESGAWPDWDADRAVTALYRIHYRSLVRLATLLVGDIATAEEIVQDSFIAVHAAWRRLRDGDRALSYLRQWVVNRSRSAPRHHMTGNRAAPNPMPSMPGAEQAEIAQLERSPLVLALRALPPRQREALVLHYYAGLPEDQIASAMGISRGAVRSHTAQAVLSLRAVLDSD